MKQWTTDNIKDQENRMAQNQEPNKKDVIIEILQKIEEYDDKGNLITRYETKKTNVSERLRASALTLKQKTIQELSKNVEISQEDIF